MYKLKYSNDNIYTGDISKTSDVKYVDVIDFDYSFVSDKSIISDYTNSTASVCFYKNKGPNIFSSGRYKEGTIEVLNETFYQCFDLNHNLDSTSGYKSSSSFLGASNISFHIDGNGGLKISFDDVYNTVNSIWVYVNNVTVYVKTNDNILYERDFDDTTFVFSIYDKKLIINSEIITTINGSFLPYSVFKYGSISNLKIESKYSMPMFFEGTGEVIDDIYGDAYCITKLEAGLGYLKSKADNVLASSNIFAFDIACRIIGNSIPFSIASLATFGGSDFIMSDAGVWVHFDTTSSGFNSNIVTTSGIVTISGSVSSLNDYYLIRCYYDGSKFGTIVNGVETYIICDNVTISGSNLNIITNDLLNIDSFAFYIDTLPTRGVYDSCLTKLNTAVSGTALVNSNDSSKFLFAADNFYPKNYLYSGDFESFGNVPISYTDNLFYIQYSLAGGEALLSSDNFYVSRLPFTEAEYNCFISENDKTFLTYFSGISVPSNKIVAESFTNYDYVNDDFITTNSGLYIRNYSKVFNPINSASIIEFSDIVWVDLLSLGVLFETDSIPVFPNINCVSVTNSGILYIGDTTFSGLDINSNNLIYFYLDGSSVVVSGSNTGVLGSGVVVSDYNYMKYFIKNDSATFASINKIYVSTTQREINTLTNKCFDYSLPECYNLDDACNELFYNTGSNVSENGIILYDYDFYNLECSFSSYYDATYSGILNVGGYIFLGINDNFESGFITERWRLVCAPYGFYGCNQPGWVDIKNASGPSSIHVRYYDGDLLTSVHTSHDYVITVNDLYYLYFTNPKILVDTISIYVTSYYINPEDGFVISCDIEYMEGTTWYMLLDDYVSPTISGVEQACSSSENAVWNPDDKSSQIQLSDGNLKATNNSDGHHNIRANICNSRFKWYWETTVDFYYSDNDYKVGIADSDADLDSQFARSDIHGYAYTRCGTKEHNSTTNYGDSYTTGDVIGTALDLETGKIWWSKNGVWQDGGVPASGINEAFNGISGRWYPAHAFYNDNVCCSVNFGDSFFIYSVPDGFNAGVYSCVNDWPIRHDIAVPIGRYDAIRITANSNWGQVVPTEIRPSCWYNYGGTSVCTTSGVTCVHVVLDDVLHVYSEYILKDSFNLSVSGINYYPFNSKLCFKDFLGNICYMKTDWISSTVCDVIVSSGTGYINNTVSGISGSILYTFGVSRNLGVVDLFGFIDGCSGYTSSSYFFSTDCLSVDLVFYNKDLPNVVGSGCLFCFESDNCAVSFSSISVGYKYEALDGTNNIVKTGVGFNTYPPNLFIDKIKGSYIGHSHKTCQELTASGFQLISNFVDNNISIKTGNQEVGGIQQVSKFNKVSLFSDYLFVSTAFCNIYLVGKDQQYTSFSDISDLIQTGDKIYFYPGTYTINTDKQITVIGIGNPIEILLNISNVSSGLTVMGCTTTKIRGSNVFNLYNCYILPWNYDESFVILYDVENINFYNCSLYNHEYICANTSYVLLYKCVLYRSNLYACYGVVTVYDEGYVVGNLYGHGPEFNRASIISGLSHVDNIKVQNFYYNLIYYHFPICGQTAIESDLCNQLVSGENTYSVYFYGDLKKIDFFSMYLFIQDLDGIIKIKNSSDFVLTIDSDNLSCGIHLVMKIYESEVNISVPISHSNVFKLSIVSVVFDGGSISVYLNGAKLATKYIIITDFNDPNSYLNDSFLFFDDVNFTCDGDGLLLKGAALQERVDFLIGTHVEDSDSGCSTTVKINIEFSMFPIISEYHGISNFYGYDAYNNGVGLYFDEGSYEYKHICFKANKSYKTYKNRTESYIGDYKIMSEGNCISESITKYISPLKSDSIVFSAATIDGHVFGHCNIIDPYGYITLCLFLPISATERSEYCFDITSSVVTFSFELTDLPCVCDVGPNQFTCYSTTGSYAAIYMGKTGIFHKSASYVGGSSSYIDHNDILNLNNNFTLEFLFTRVDDGAGFKGSLITKGTSSCNIAYCVGINDRYIPYFKWSWEGDNVICADRAIQVGDITYLSVVVGTNTISFYINGKRAGIKYTDKLKIINNSESLYFIRGYDSSYYINCCVEEICILNRIKTEDEIEATWDTIGGGDNAPWIKINNIVVVSDKPIKVSPSDRFIEKDGLIDTSKWEYTAYRPLDSSDGLVLDSRTAKKLKSKVVSYNVIFNVSVFCEFLEYSVNRDWSIKFKYRFISGNYVAVVIDYVKYDDIYIKCEYYYNGYKNSTDKIKFMLSFGGIRFFTDYNGYTYAQVGNYDFWYTLWTSTQKLFVETSGWLEVTLSNDDWDSWFIVKLTKFLPRLYCSSIVNGETVDFYDAVPYGRAFYNQIPENVAMLCLSNDVFEIDAISSCIHSLEFINGQMKDLHVLNTTNRIFDNVNYEVFNIELLVYLTYSNTNVLDLFPWITIDVKDKYLYVTMHDNDRTITDSINEFLNDYIYIAVSIGNPHTTLYINDQKFVYDTNFSDILPYHFYPIGKSFSGRVVYFCGYYGDFDVSGYNFRVSSLSRCIGFDACARKVFGNNIVTSLDPYSIIYAYDNPIYSSMLVSKSCSLGCENNIDVGVLYDPAVLQSSVSFSVIVRCKYSSLAGKKKTFIAVSAIKHNVSHNYYGSFGDVGDSQDIFNYNLSGTCYNNDSIFILDIDKNVLEDILKGITVLNIKNNETISITNIYIYLNSELSINDIYGSSLLV